jgi:hypothetical protein|tara:strand:- start:4145 stop:4354 length:210 start_codon:yes stop_codon:yes gene_type:complete
MNYNLIKVNDILLEIKREFNPSYFVTDKNSNKMNQKLIGMWVDHLECDRVVRQNDKVLICKTIEEAQIV